MCVYVLRKEHSDPKITDKWKQLPVQLTEQEMEAHLQEVDVVTESSVFSWHVV